MTGYSGTPLLKKLGIKPDMKIMLINQPKDYFKLLEADIRDQIITKNQTPDLVHLFVENNKSFESEMKKLQKLLPLNPTITIWVSWHKKSAGIKTDLTEDVIRNYALQHDLVDIKVIAVSELWSGLKLVIQKAKRVAK